MPRQINPEQTSELLFTFLDPSDGAQIRVLFDVGGTKGIWAQKVYGSTATEVTAVTNPTGNQANAGKLSDFRYCQRQGLLPTDPYSQGVTFVGIGTYPFAQIVLVDNADFCTIEQSTYIQWTKTNFGNQSFFGSNDGYIDVRAISTENIIKYQLKKDTGEILSGFTESGVFENLQAGIYIVTASDSVGNALTKTITIGTVATIPYGVRYRIPFRDFEQNSNWRIDIEKREYTGIIEEVRAAGIPVKIEWEGKELFDPIIYSSAKIELVSEFPDQFAELFTPDETTWRVRIYRNFVLFWAGYLLPDLYSESYSNPNYYVTIEATDGLKLMENYLYDRPYMMSIGNIFLTCLSSTLSLLPVWVAIDWTPTEYQQTDTSPAKSVFTFAGINMDGAIGESVDAEEITMHDMLERLLTQFGMQVRQHEGSWFIFQPRNLQKTFQLLEFGSNTIQYADFDNIISLIDIAAVEQEYFIDDSQYYEVESGYGSYELINKYKPRTDLIKEGNFNENAWTKTANIPLPGKYELRHWFGNLPYSRGLERDRDGYVATPSAIQREQLLGVIQQGVGDYLTMRPYSDQVGSGANSKSVLLSDAVYLENEVGLEFEFSLTVRILAYTGGITRFRLPFIIEWGNWQYDAEYNRWSPRLNRTTWIEFNQDDQVNNVGIYEKTLTYNIPALIYQPDTVFQPNRVFPWDGFARVRLNWYELKINQSEFLFKFDADILNVSLKIKYDGTEPINEYSLKRVDRRYTREYKSKTLYFSTPPNYINQQYLFPYHIVDRQSEKLLTLWQDVLEGSEKLRLEEMLMREILYQYDTPKRVVFATARGKYSRGIYYQIEYDNQRVFYVYKRTYYPSDSKVDVEMIEVAKGLPSRNLIGADQGTYLISEDGKKLLYGS